MINNLVSYFNPDGTPTPEGLKFFSSLDAQLVALEANMAADIAQAERVVFNTYGDKVSVEENEKHAFVETLKDAIINAPNVASHFEGAEINTIDGLRADFEDGWGLVRPSNTTPVLVVRFDAEIEEALERIKSLFRRQMLDLKPDLDLPF